jgi:hypothetical protein
MVGPFISALLALQSVAPPRTGILFDCGSGGLTVFAPVDRGLGRYRIAWGDIQRRGYADGSSEDSIGFESVGDELPGRLVIRWRGENGRRVAATVFGYNSAARSAKFVVRQEISPAQAVPIARGVCVARTQEDSLP